MGVAAWVLLCAEQNGGADCSGRSRRSARAALAPQVEKEKRARKREKQKARKEAERARREAEEAERARQEEARRAELERRHREAEDRRRWARGTQHAQRAQRALCAVVRRGRGGCWALLRVLRARQGLAKPGCGLNAGWQGQCCASWERGC